MTSAPNSHRKSFTETIKPWIQLSRVGKFAGTMVLFWPYAWSATMAAYVLKLDVPSFVGAGCIWNDILDRDFDRQVERTKMRPLAAGTITVPGALAFLSVHLILLFGMIWSLNQSAFYFGFLAIVVFPGVYPLMKRVTYWPQAWLGMAMNVGAAMPWLALGEGLPAHALVLYAGSWSWTIWYDTIYACQDKCDDVRAGVKSTALLFGNYIRPILTLFASGLMLALYLAGRMSGMGLYFHTMTVGGGALYLGLEMLTVDLDSPQSCWETFHRNGFHFGAVVWSGVIADYLTSIRSYQ